MAANKFALNMLTGVTAFFLILPSFANTPEQSSPETDATAVGDTEPASDADGAPASQTLSQRKYYTPNNNDILDILPAPDETPNNDETATNNDRGTVNFELTGRAQPPMWRLADEDSEVWLLGTFHILPPDIDWRSNTLASAIDAAETIYFEAEVDTPEAQQKTVQTLITQGFLPSGETLSGLLTSAEIEKLTAAASQVNLPIAAVDTMRPWQAFLTLTVQNIVAQGFDPGAGIEPVLLKEARLRGRNLRFFESVEEQLSLFTSLPREVELTLLQITLEEWDQQNQELQELFAAWSAGDVEKIDALMNGSMRTEAPQVYDALITNRNKAWVSRITDVMNDSGKVLVAVGAGHLVGDNSVPALLRAQGYEVTRIGVNE